MGDLRTDDRKKPDFTGVWVFNPEKSTLQIDPPDSTAIVINHREPGFRLSRTHTRENASDTLSLELVTDGRELVLDQAGIRIRGRVFWDADTLVFDTTLIRGEDEATNIVRYRLSDLPASLIAEESFRSRSVNYDNVWVMDRKKS
ncbi:MAG TPA: hypothetical protein VLY03_05385 [Bacteroidota bacterium]|nr:hypothetical protein [Bacteroidota bacterium]